jgi:hypothetical protein
MHLGCLAFLMRMRIVLEQNIQSVSATKVSFSKQAFHLEYKDTQETM